MISQYTVHSVYNLLNDEQSFSTFFLIGLYECKYKNGQKISQKKLLRELSLIWRGEC